MRELFPTPADPVDPLGRYLDDARPPPSSRPWVMLNMIASIDGGTAVDGVSGGLGGPADKKVFRAVRACADWILVASATAAAEGYRHPRPDDEVVAARRARGRADPPRLAIVTASGRLDPTIPALAAPSEGAQPTLVITGTRSDRSALADTDVELVVVDHPRPTPMAVLGALADRDARVVLAEGGPTWNGLLADAGVIDEVCLSLSPTLVGGDSPRIVAGATGAATPMRLDRLLESDGLLFARYLRR